MTNRADNITETRRRIVEATVKLHGTVGLAAASIAAIAAEAGVTRLTVYRHFAGRLELFEACTAHWMSSQKPPDPEGWAAIDDPEQRLRTGLADLYRFYRDGAQMLTWVHRDWHTIPDELRTRLETRDADWRDVLAEPFDVTEPVPHRLHAVLGHAMGFPTWQSLCQQQCLSNDDAVDVMVALVLAVAQSSAPHPRGS